MPTASTVATVGPFAFTRDPMYLGMVLGLLGWAVLLGSPAPFIVFPYFALIHFRFVLRTAAIHGRAVLSR